ncbi:MAG: hypothetical protein ACK5NG_02250 [Chthoniobacterales bacterium]
MEQEALLRKKEDELARRLKAAPQQMEKLRKKQNERAQMYVSTTMSNPEYAGRFSGTRSQRRQGRAGTARRKRAQADRLKFIALLIILLTLIVLIWRIIPTS